MQSCSCSYSKCVCSAIVVLVIDDTRVKHDHSVQDAAQSLMLLRVAHSTRMNCGSDSGPTTTHDYWHCPHIAFAAGSMHLSGVRPAVPSGRCTPLLPVCCCGPGGQETSTDCCTVAKKSARVRAGPVVSGRARVVEFSLYNCWYNAGSVGWPFPMLKY